MDKLNKLAELNAIIDKLIVLLEAKIFINSDINEDIYYKNKTTKKEKDKN